MGHAAARPDTAAGPNAPLDVWMHQQLIKQEAEIKTIKAENIRLHRQDRRLKVSALVCRYAHGKLSQPKHRAQPDKISAYGPHKRGALHSGDKQKSAFDPSTVESKTAGNRHSNTQSAMADGGVIRSTTVSRQERHQPNLGDTASGDEQECADAAGVTFSDEDDVTRELWSESDHFEGVIDKGRP